MIARAKETFHFDGGTEHGGTERPADDPLVVRFPAMYERVEDEAPAEQATPRRGRPPVKATGGDAK